MAPKRRATAPIDPIIATVQAAAAARGILPAHLAKAAGLSLSTAQRMLAGEGSPSLATLRAACTAVGVELRATRAKD